MKKYLSNQDLLQTINTMLPLISEASHASEASGKLRSDVLEALFKSRVFRFFVPEALNGEPVALPTALEVFEKIAYADGAAGWIAMIGAGGGLFAGFLEEETSKAIFVPERGVIAGSGMSLGKAVRREGGYIVTGRWPYASGADHASYFTAVCKVEGKEEEMFAVAMPAEKVTVHSTWNVFGLKATGSHDFSVENLFVPDRFIFSLFSEPKLDDPIYKCPLEVLGSLTFASVAIGVARHAFDVFHTYAKGKTVKGSDDRLIQDKGVRQSVDEAGRLINRQRELLYWTVGQVWNTLETGTSPDDSLKQEVDACGTGIVQESIRAVNLLYFRAGMMPLFESSEFGRAWRDLHTLSQNAIVAVR